MILISLKTEQKFSVFSCQHLMMGHCVFGALQATPHSRRTTTSSWRTCICQTRPLRPKTQTDQKVFVTVDLEESCGSSCLKLHCRKPPTKKISDFQIEVPPAEFSKKEGFPCSYRWVNLVHGEFDPSLLYFRLI